MLTPGIDLTPGDYVFYISDGWCTDESPKLSLPGGFPQVMIYFQTLLTTSA